MKNRLSFSQFGEDIIIAGMLAWIRNGFYVDIGAHHPFKFSNSALLHIRGWRGINVEPSIEGYELFRRFRGRDINLKVAVHNKLKTVEFFKFEGGLCNTIVAKRKENQKRKKNYLGSNSIACMSINEIYENFVPKNRVVGFMNVDIEGYDHEALQGFDLAKYQPHCICVEIHGADMLNLKQNRTVKLLVKYGYTLIAVNKFSFIFVSAKLESRIKKT